MRSSLVFTAHARTMMHERGIIEDSFEEPGT
jgi:hypothetical protein